jgi:hypothetical protein
LFHGQPDERKYAHHLLATPVLRRKIKVKTTGHSMVINH